MVEEVTAQLSDQMDREPEVRVQEGMFATVDPLLLQLAFQNLLENSFKFAGEGGPQVEVGQRDNVFYVRDRGIGFDPAYSQKIFKPFERLHRDQEFPGTGIGLANVSRIIERHGGTIWAESSPGEGATFFFTLG
jgi:signal transduction histidine kinase